MSDIQADYDLLNDVATQFQSQEQVSEQLRQRVTQAFAALEDGGWIGLGADAFFAEMHATVFPALERLQRAMEHARSITLQTAESLRQAEDEAARLFQHDYQQQPAAGSSGSIPGVIASAATGVAARSGGNGGSAARETSGTARVVTAGATSGDGGGGGGGSGGGGGGGGSEGGGGGGGQQANPEEQKAEEQKTREQAKKVAADAAVAMNDAAAVLAIASTVGGPVFAVCSGVAWLMGNRYQKLANDPPRPDFQMVARFAPRELNLLTAAAGEPNVWNDFASSQIQLAAAMDDLVTSIERYDGAQIAAAASAGQELSRISESASRQREAIAHNARACALLIDDTLQLAPALNEAWAAQVQQLPAGDGVKAARPEFEPGASREDVLAGVVRALSEMPQFTTNDIDGFRQALSATPQAGQPPQVLFDAQWRDQMRAMASDLRVLADAHAGEGG